MDKGGTSGRFAISLAAYGVIAGILTLLFFLVSSAGGTAIFIGYDGANQSEDGNCAVLALLSQHMILATTFYLAGATMLFRHQSAKIRLILGATGAALLELAAYAFIGAQFCAG